MGCKNDLYIVMIEVKSRKIQSFLICPQKKTIYSFRENLKPITYLEDNLSLLSKWSQFWYNSWECLIKSSFSFVKFYKRIGLFAVGIPYWLVHIISFFLALHLRLKIYLSRVLMYMFFGNIFQIIDFHE